MDIPRTAVPTKVISTLSIYLLLSALCPLGRGFYLQSVLAADKGADIDKPAPAPKPDSPVTNWDRLIVSQPTWQHYVQRAEAIIKSRDGGQTSSQKSKRAISDCLASLRLQNSPIGLRMLTRAYLLGGPANYKLAAAAAQKYLDATAGTPGALQLVAFTSLLVGDVDACRAALAHFVDAEVKNGHPEARTLALSGLPAENSFEMDSCLAGAFEPATPVHQAQHLLITALLKLFQKQYQAVETTSGAFEKHCGTLAQPKYRDLALIMTASAALLNQHHEKAKALLLPLLSGQSPPPEVLLLVDDLYFAGDKRDEVLKLFGERIGSQDNCALARARALDEMGQPREALKILQILSSFATRSGKTDKVSSPAFVRSDMLFENTLLERARLESKLGLNSDALTHLHACIEQNPSAGQPYFIRAQIYAQQKQWSPAAKDLTKAIDNGFSLIKSTRARAACYSSLGQAVLAKNDMSTAAAFSLIGQ